MHSAPELPRPPTPLRYGARSAVWAPLPGNAASGPIRARFQSILLKVSQNGRVYTKYVEKACHSPCFIFTVQKSPLDFLGFPYLRAFSHKELMGYFDPWVDEHCQNDEVSPVCTHRCAKGSVRYPHGTTQTSCSCGAAPHLTSARYCLRMCLVP